MGGGPDLQSAVGIHQGHAGHGFQVAGVLGMGLVGFFVNQMGACKACVRIAALKFDQVRQVVAARMNARTAGLQRLLRAQQGGQLLVFDLDQVQRIAGNLF